MTEKNEKDAGAREDKGVENKTAENKEEKPRKEERPRGSKSPPIGEQADDFWEEDEVEEKKEKKRSISSKDPGSNKLKEKDSKKKRSGEPTDEQEPRSHPPYGNIPPPYGRPPKGYQYAGTDPGGTQGPPPPGYYGTGAPRREYSRVFRGKYGSYKAYPPSKNDSLLAGLSYLSVLLNFILPIGWLVPLIMLYNVKPLSPWLKFHLCQSLTLLIIAGILWVLSIVMTSIGPPGICVMPFGLALIVYMIVVGILVFVGKDHRAPWIGDWVEENWI